ncbi:MAG: hypothetical protein ACODAQ_04470, partial [Phycisphaeraceae bacterium]
FDHLLITKWQMLDARTQPVDALILGDSSGNQGVDPDILEDRVGGEWLNLCTVGNMLTVGSAWMLNDYVERFGPPDRILMIHVYEVWHRPAHPSAFARIPRPWGFWKEYDPPVHFSERQLVEIALARYVPLYAADVSLRQLIMHPRQTIAGRPEIRDDGFMPMHDPWPEEVRQDYEAQRRHVEESTFKASHPNRAGLDRLLELADRHDIEIYYAHGPTYDRLVEHEAFQRYFADVQAMLEQVEREHERFHLLFHEPQPFPIDQLQNVEHVTVEGAEVYTRRIAEAIAARQPRRRNGEEGD